LLAVLAGCGGSSSSPEGAVQQFLDALAERDTARFEASFTAETRELVAEIESLSSVAQGVEGALGLEEWCRAFCGGTVEGSTLHGDSATVRVRAGENVEEIPVIRVEDGWRVDFTSRLDEAVQILRLALSAAAVPAGLSGVGDTIVPAGSPPADSAHGVPAP
jgi:hypothetical protein